METVSDIDDLAGRAHALLAERLDAAFRSVDRKQIVVAFHAEGRSSLAGVASAGECADATEWKFPAGCFAKLFTGALVKKAIGEGYIGLRDRVAELLDVADHVETLGGATVRDLLDHTHGLDDSALDWAPVLERNGALDVKRLLAALAPHRLAPAGQIYSYSNCGAWLMAAILERLKAKPFAEQLDADLFAPLGVRLVEDAMVASRVPNKVCASRGAALAISAADVLTFLRFQALSVPDRWAPLSSEITPLAGWNPLERGVFWGWKHHGDHWFGHSSVWPNASGMVRVHPRSGIAIVIASKYHPAPVVATKLFADLLPEIKGMSFPKPLRQDVAAGLDLQKHCGDYHSAAQTLCVRFSTGQLRLTAAGIDSALIPAADETFFVRPATQGRFTFVQFPALDHGRLRYLWDGARVYLRRD
jgi:hypothetical protein